MTFLEKLFFIVILIFLIFATVCYLIWKFRRRFTRERFAFFSTTMIFMLFTTVVVPMLQSESILTFLIKVINKVFKLNVPIVELDVWAQTFIVIVFLGIMILIRSIHKNWDGAVSVRQYEEERLSQRSGMLKDSIAQIIYLINESHKLEIHNRDEQEAAANVLRKIDEKELVWHVQAAELLSLISNQYKILIETDWYSEYSTFISKYGKNEELLGIYCATEQPKTDELKRFIDFVRTNKQKVHKLVVAIKNGEQEKQEIEFEGFRIEIRYEKEMLDNLVDFSPYFETVKRQFEIDEITPGCGNAIKDIYVDLTGKLKEGQEIGHVENYALNWTKSKEEGKYLAILAEYGQGKSVLSLKIAYEMICNRMKNSRIPILIVLRGKSPRNLSPLEIVSAWASNYDINPRAIIKLHKAGRLMLIFEGFDEMDLVGDAEMRLAHFQKLWEFSTAKAKILITGRPNFFLDTKELATALGTQPHLKGDPYCEAIYLQRFSDVQIEKALRSANEKTRNEILLLILGDQKNENFYDLVARPSTLFLVSQIWEARKLSEKKETINSAIVIQEFIQNNYARQQAKNIDIKYTVLNVHEREYFMLGAAVGMMKSNSYSNQISKADLQQMVRTLYDNFPEEISKIQTAFDAERRVSLKERMKNLPYAEESVLTDVRSCGILVNDLARLDYFKFAHKSFLEFLVSQYFVNLLLKRDERYIMMVNAILKALSVNLSEVETTDETLSFIAQLFLNQVAIKSSENSEKDCKKLFAILYPYKILSRFPRIVLHSDKLFPFVPIFMFIFPIIFFALETSAFSGMSKGDSLIFVGLGSVFLASIFGILHFSISSVVKMRMKIWFICIKELKIAEEFLFKLASKRYIEYLKGERKSVVMSIFSMMEGHKN